MNVVNPGGEAWRKMRKRRKKQKVKLNAPAEPTRSKVLHVRLTEAELESVARHAKRVGMVPAVFVRACLHYVTSREVTP